MYTTPLWKRFIFRAPKILQSFKLEYIYPPLFQPNIEPLIGDALRACKKKKKIFLF